MKQIGVNGARIVRTSLLWALVLALAIAVFPVSVAGCTSGATAYDAASYTAPVSDAPASASENTSAPVSDAPALASENTSAPVSTAPASASENTSAPTPEATATATASKNTSEAAVEANGKVIVIDAGHQKKANSQTEPIGPGATTRKPKVAGGTRGVVTGNPEYKITLQVAKRLRTVLKERGYTVYMVRTKNDVNIPNSKRAKFANKKKADLFIRLHCDAAGQASGFLTLTPAKNKWTKKFYKRSLKASKIIHKAVLANTGATDRGISKRSDLSGFNYAKVPSVLFEMGVMTNATDDRLLASKKYQKKLAVGIANGADKYFKVKS